MTNPEISVGGITIDFQESTEVICNSVSKAQEYLATANADASTIEHLRCICESILKIFSDLKENPNPYRDSERLITLHDSVLSCLHKICGDNSSEFRDSAYKVLIDLLPLQTYVGKRFYFPDNYFADVVKIAILSKEAISLFLPPLQELISFPDISQNIWKGIDIVCCKQNLSLTPDEVSNILDIINSTEKPKKKKSEECGPFLYYCRTSGGVINDKEVGKSIEHFWEKLSAVDLPHNIMRKLLLTLIERLMPRMKRPIFLTDFFINTLEYGGSVSILALQGIFVLYRDENMNYPDVYTKLYSMVTPDLFNAQYKARFYYLTDIFLTSTHLPEGLVAGFVKKLARLSLVAPPPDAVILLAFVVNLLIRHRGLRKLIHNPTSVTYETDPWLPDEPRPEASRAGESSLWEVELLRSHTVPAVSGATAFLRQPLPGVEVELGPLLEVTTDEMFLKEHKKKMKNPPVSFEKPTSLLTPNVPNNGLSLWSLSA